MPSRCLLFFLLVLFGCDRAPLEQVGPNLEIVSPDLGIALSSPALVLQLRDRSDQVTSVRVNGVETERSSDNIFTARVAVTEPGPIPLEIVSTGRSGAESVLSTSALYLPYAFGSLSSTQENSVGEHAAVVLPGGSVLVAGGVSTPDGEATRAAFLFGLFGNGSEPLPRDSLLTARAGHTMTSLPDGRILVLGGASRAFPTQIDELVTSAEVFDPVTGQFLPVTQSLRDPIQRAQHTAVAVPLPDGGAALYLTGGVGVAGLRAGAPFFGTISTLRRLRYEPGVGGDGGRLVQDASDPTDGPRVAYFVEHAESAVVGVPGVTALVGAKDSSGFVDESFRSFYGPRLRDSRLFPLPDPPEVSDAQAELVRAGHAGAPGLSGLAVFTGGRRPDDPNATPLATTTVYADEPRKRFVLSETGDLQVPRWGHTATSVGSGRILIIGGFGRDGEPARLVEIFGPR